jgi:hypothetical protein
VQGEEALDMRRHDDDRRGCLEERTMERVV